LSAALAEEPTFRIEEVRMSCERSLSGAAVALLAGFCLVAAAGEAPRSGPPAGGKTNRFDVHDVTGESKGKSVCYV
jgi:hypothetical protein